MNFSDRALHALSAGRLRLLRASVESALLGEICQAIVEHGGYRAAWVSFAEQGDTKTLRPVAACGLEREAVASVQRLFDGYQRSRQRVGIESIRRYNPHHRRGFGVGERAAADARGRGRR